MVVEAMAAGLPVVAVNSGGYRETLRGLDAYLYKPDNPMHAAEILWFLADNPRERDSYANVLFKRYASSYSMDAHTSRLEQIYREVVATRT